ncbi:hypothetical protein OF83DRAFT_457197 [Amylostereum chailletii]|nr:hypothetical protein OF83DRAFT_457197 [Amylostereum chailletii]
MDYDRKSTVSSFYGRQSADALHQDYPPPSAPPGGPHGRRDSTSSFFNPNAMPQPHERGQPPSAGYNSRSYYDAGREEPVKGHYADEGGQEAGFDVFADFNNAGPRYSSAFGLGGNTASYHPIGSPSAVAKHEEEASSLGPVEMVTVPALGAEWKASELRDMTKRGKRERNAEKRSRSWKAFNRNEKGLFGRKWLTKRVLVFVVFFLIVVAGIALAFTIPRVPTFNFNSDTPLTAASGSFNDSIPTLFSVSPANFSFAAIADLQVHTPDNFLPLTFKGIDATVTDLNTRRQVATGHLGHLTVPAKEFTEIQMPLNFSYSAVNNSDATWVSWHKACENKALTTDGNRDVQFRLVIQMDIAGLPSKHSTSTTVTNAACPIELPQNAA